MASQGMEGDKAPTSVASNQPRVGNGGSSASLESPMDSPSQSDNEYENPTLSNADGKVYIESSVFYPEASRKKLVNMIIMHKYPISIVEHYGFKELSATLQPYFKIPSRKTVRSDIMEVYAAEKSKIMDILRKSSCRVAITMDMWTASNQRKRYMAITAHFIDNNWKLQSLIMRFVYVPYPYTSDVLSKELLKCIFDWNIEEKLSTLTVDNCSINDGIVDTIVSKLNPSHLLLRGKLTKMSCCVHILNLIVQDGLNAIGDGLQRIRDSVAFWIATPTRHQTFRETTTLLGKEYSKQLVLDCMAQWHSTYLMLNIALEYKDVFHHLQQQEPLFTCAPDEENWVLVDGIYEILHQFHMSLNAFLGRKCPTPNVLFLLMFEIKYAFDDWITSSSLAIKTVAESMLAKFDKYWKEVRDIMAVATVFDPRFKLRFIERFFSKFYGELANDEIQRVKKYCYDLFDEYKSSLSNVTEENEVRRCSLFGSLEVFDSAYAAYMRDCRKSLKPDLDRYLETDSWPITGSLIDDFDIIDWWKGGGGGMGYPVLSKMVKDILAIQIYTESSKSIFSTSDKLVSPHKSKLRANTLEALICTQNWLSKDLTGECSKEKRRRLY